jgi:cell wall-associated NlpC family hydrolase
VIPGWVAGYVGIPYRPHGQDRSGVDCWGLIRMVHRDVWGRELPAFAYGGDRQERAALFKAEADFLSRDVPTGEVGDAVFLRVAGVVGHVGLVLGDGMMLHAKEGADSCIEPYDRGRWARRVEGFRRP